MNEYLLLNSSKMPAQKDFNWSNNNKIFSHKNAILKAKNSLHFDAISYGFFQIEWNMSCFSFFL